MTPKPADVERLALRVVAVVVSHNRRALLRQVLEGLLGQTTPPAAVVVVDNSSSDGSPEMVEDEFPTVRLVPSGGNLGGAGGFAVGIEEGLRLDPSHLWLMDDDAVPESDALEQLSQAHVRVRTQLGTDPALLTSLVTDAAGNLGARNKPYVSVDFDLHLTGRAVDLIPIRAATFVGPLVAADVARRIHLPYREFFIWHDDIEYTSRVCALGAAFLVPASRITHHVSNAGPGTLLGDRLYYDVRNRIWLGRLAACFPRTERLSIGLGAARTAVQQVRLAEDKARTARLAARAIYDASRGAPSKRPPVT